MDMRTTMMPIDMNIDVAKNNYHCSYFKHITQTTGFTLMKVILTQNNAQVMVSAVERS